MFARRGVPIPGQTLCGWSGVAHDACTLIIEALKRVVFADGNVQVDETPVKYQDPERKGVCGTGYLWVAHNPVRNVSLFARHTGSEAACSETLVPKGFTRIIQCDGYSTYEAFLKQPSLAGSIQLAGCMVHARRKFFEAKAEGADPQWVLEQMQQLYQIEARLREARAGPNEVQSTRQEQSAAIMARIKARLEHLQAKPHAPPAKPQGRSGQLCPSISGPNSACS